MSVNDIMASPGTPCATPIGIIGVTYGIPSADGRSSILSIIFNHYIREGDSAKE
jgi:hypothetical protein